jgi:hypothetical protein
MNLGPRIAMPVATLLVSVIVAVLLTAGVWSAAIAIGPWGMPEFIAGMAGIGLTGTLAVVGVLVIKPWKPRTMADWMTVWLAGTVFRLFVTPLAAYLLYSAVSPALAYQSFGLAVALTYLAALFVEAGVLARHVNAISDSPSATGDDRPRNSGN